MRQIFISYAREDRPFAERLAKAFETLGWSVWWDRTIPAGRSFDEVIDAALQEAKCVVVLWSANSIKSQWVMAEAQDGADRGILIPVQVEDGVRVPLGFRRIQAASLTGWSGSLQDPEFTRLVEDVSRLMGVPSPNDAPPQQPRVEAPPQRPRVEEPHPPMTQGGSQNRGIVIGSAIAVVALALAAILLMRKDQPADAGFVSTVDSAAVPPSLVETAPSPAAAEPPASAARPRAVISDARYLDEASDLVGVFGNGSPNNRQDSHFRLVLQLENAAQEIKAIQVRLTDATGQAGGGNIWRTSSGDAWMVGVRHGQRWLTPGYVTTLGRFGPGAVTLDLYVDGGAVQSDQFYAIDVTMGDGRTLTRLLSTTVASSSLAPQTPSRFCRGERSTASEQNTDSVSIRFTNPSFDTVQVFWLNLTGERVWYQTLPPHTFYEQQTYRNHYWVVTRADGTCLALIRGGTLKEFEVQSGG